MDQFQYRDGQLHCEDVPLEELLRRCGSPVYVYSKKTLVDHYRGLADAFAPLAPTILYSAKSCGNIHILRALAEVGAGIDVVSGGELFRALLAGVPAERIVFAGVGKSEGELSEALRAGVGWLNVESEQELETIERVARERGQRARVALRINPDIADSRTHAKTTTGNKGSKFGIDFDRVEATVERFGKSPSLAIDGIHFHIGSPIYSAEPYVKAIDRALELVTRVGARSHPIRAINIGGGFMAEYGQAGARAPRWGEYADPIVARLREFKASNGTILMEPGRSISANAGVLLTRVLYVKESGGRRVVVVDTGMTHLVRPAMYDAWHFMWPVRVPPEHVPESRGEPTGEQGFVVSDVVGPICESSDVLGRGRKLPPLERGDHLCIFSAGAYGMSMASQYNAVPRPPEVLVHGAEATLVRRRETYEDLVSAEIFPRPL